MRFALRRWGPGMAQYRGCRRGGHGTRAKVVALQAAAAPDAPRYASGSSTLMSRIFCQEKAMALSTMLPLSFALLLGAPFAVAQSNLGELLDAGAKKLSVE